ncbi:uncharacterized protein [Drosophila bipectinata]|uniref:uncharacterized protein n=1 Tax=Drosophila bipectinata TaxID=42026 RepID=UPI0038B38394
MATGNIVTRMGGNALRNMEENCHNLVKDCCSSGKNGINLNKMAQKWTDEGSSKNIRIDIRRDRNQVKSSAGGHRPSKYIERSRGVKVVQQTYISQFGFHSRLTPLSKFTREEIVRKRSSRFVKKAS